MSSLRWCSAILVSCGALLAGYSSGAAAAADWQPHRPIEVIVASGPGGGQDLVARTLQAAIQQTKLSKEPVTVINRPGGGGTVAIAYLDSHPGNGHYVGIQALPLITNQINGMSKMGLKDVTPLALLITEPGIFTVAANSPIKSGQDLIAALRKDPSSVSIGVSSSPGGQSQIAMALVAKAAGIDPRKLKIAFFDSGGEAVTALMGNHVDVSVTPAGTVIGPSQAGKLRMIAIPSATREEGPLANVPTWKEQGVNVEFLIWRVLIGPKNMPANEVAWWDHTLAKATSSPQWLSAVKRNLWTADYKDSTQTRKFLDSEQARLVPLLQELGLAKTK